MFKIIIGSPDPSFDPIELEVKNGHFEKEYYDINDENLPEKLYYYIRFITKERLPEAEPIIMKDSKYACWYAYYMIQGRWPEAEPTIMKHPQWAFNYAYYVIRGRWPEAEPTIIKDPHWAYNYAADIIKGRWPEAEHYCTIYEDYAFYYNNMITNLK